MPIYEYVCAECGERFDKLVRSMSAQQRVECPRCGCEEVEKAVSLFGIGGGSRTADPSCSPRSGSV
jgi:putative FmdB family regulatory protein